MKRPVQLTFFQDFACFSKANPFFAHKIRSGHLVYSTQKSEFSTSEIRKSIVKTILYFDIFRFPITLEEIRFYLTEANDPDTELQKLVSDGVILQQGIYFGLGNIAENVLRRESGAERAKNSMKVAQKMTRRLTWIPFVRCVGISGSLSKGYMDSDSDIDFFIIVQENRLWIVRAIFSFVFKWVGLLGQENIFCPNYVLVDNKLKVPDQSLYTAIEIHSLIPMYNQSLYETFVSENNWAGKTLPNARLKTSFLPKEKSHRLSVLWNSSFFSYLDDLFFSIFQKHYQKKFNQVSKLDAGSQEIRFVKNEFRMHESGHRGKILDQFNQKINEFTRMFNIELT
jgi:hypothetical protein